VQTPHGVPKRPASGASRCRRKFLRFFPKGFRDETYIDWERGYKARAHEAWIEELGPAPFAELVASGRFEEIAARAVRIESRTNLLFSFEKMALRDAVRSRAGARRFSEGLGALLHRGGDADDRFERWCETVALLPRRKTRVLTWPVVTVFPFLARPKEHIFFKPAVTRRAADRYGFELDYRPRPGAAAYRGLLRFAATVRRDLRDLRPRDMIDVQSFLWVQGSDEYA